MIPKSCRAAQPAEVPVQENQMPTATQVAEWIVRYRSDDLGVPVDSMQLQKLIVYAQSFCLALTGEPLFADEVHAWRDGIVVKKVYHAYKPFGSQPIVAPELEPGEDGNEPRFTERVESFLKQVISFLGGYTAIRLSDAVHSEEPWRQARQGYKRRDLSDVWIKKDTLRAYYRSLVVDGEAALSRQEMLSTIPDPRWGQFYLAGICVRRMAAHPFYDRSLAESLAKPVPADDRLPPSAFEPIQEKEYLDLGDTSGLSPEEIARRAREAYRVA